MEALILKGQSKFNLQSRDLYVRLGPKKISIGTYQSMRLDELNAMRQPAPFMPFLSLLYKKI